MGEHHRNGICRSHRVQQLQLAKRPLMPPVFSVGWFSGRLTFSRLLHYEGLATIAAYSSMEAKEDIFTDEASLLGLTVHLANAVRLGTVVSSSPDYSASSPFPSCFCSLLSPTIPSFIAPAWCLGVLFRLCLLARVLRWHAALVVTAAVVRPCDALVLPSGAPPFEFHVPFNPLPKGSLRPSCSSFSQRQRLSPLLFLSAALRSPNRPPPSVV